MDAADASASAALNPNTKEGGGGAQATAAVSHQGAAKALLSLFPVALLLKSTNS